MKKLVALFAMLAVLTACGGGGRPSTDDIADSLKDSDNPVGQTFSAADLDDETIDCLAEAIHDSDLSDDAVQALVDGDEDYAGDSGDDDALTGLGEDMAACVTP